MSSKDAFTLIELAIVITIIGLFYATLFPALKLYLYNTKIDSTKKELKAIKQNLISYASIYGKLPPSTPLDSLEQLPYIDLNVKQKDIFGIPYYYDVADALVTSDDTNICKVLSSYSNKVDLPMVEEDNGSIKYSVVAVIISSGIDKKLQDNNSDLNRVYSSITNSYSSTKDDLIEELTYFELLNSICVLNDFNHTR